jgi:enoyl-CoA hydratase/carnithine racemase
VKVEIQSGIAILALEKGKVNALTVDVVEEIYSGLKKLESEDEARAVIVIGHGNFFSFGFDVPEFMTFSKEKFTEFLVNFSNLYSYLFLYPKPVIAALNGHTIAAGCMLAVACDRRIMISEKAKISLNEIGFGSSVFAGATEILRFQVGSKNATDILYSGAMYYADEAQKMGLVDQIVDEANLMQESLRTAQSLGEKSLPAFKSIKRLLREPIVEIYQSKELDSIKELVDIWYSETTWANLKKIQIH